MELNSYDKSGKVRLTKKERVCVNNIKIRCVNKGVGESFMLVAPGYFIVTIMAIYIYIYAPRDSISILSQRDLDSLLSERTMTYTLKFLSLPTRFPFILTMHTQMATCKILFYNQLLNLC